MNFKKPVSKTLNSQHLCVGCTTTST